jgi:hypothetical protein
MLFLEKKFDPPLTPSINFATSTHFVRGRAFTEFYSFASCIAVTSISFAPFSLSNIIPWIHNQCDHLGIAKYTAAAHICVDYSLFQLKLFSCLSKAKWTNE